ncbi:hypothetical protein CkaCkLH20_12312 [Colletotrichum karsti]|uniref:Uncharacterized protein n=1 Tax=Colletotrichum karsti TaxID=1095194 RepID=A0A9P6LEL5_9PEZI|nr:uncharacterized protein CkaCkLH20_12312 [Colletotrichum karsti]KAF9870226.1 hypothetical protein CkaCkLH20_12312 [Colletotrichum karsti]
MHFNLNIVLITAAILAQAEGGLIGDRQATCKNCPLNPGNVVKQIFEMVTNRQSHTDCRWEATFGLPEDLGGPEKPSYDHLIRVNYNEKDNTCSVETNNRVEAMGDNIYCIQGGCGIKEVTDTHAVVAWGACVIKDTVNFTPDQAMGTRECTDAQGEIKFARFHDSDHCDGSEMLSASVGGRDHRDFSPTERSGGSFWGGVVTFCSALSNGS